MCKFYTEHLTKELRGEVADNNTFVENYRRRLISIYKSEEAHRKKQRQQQQDQGRMNNGQSMGGQGAAGGGSHNTSGSSLDQNEASRALSRNPAISIRELFPGEDELGLSVHLPFAQTPGLFKTPEGWTRGYSLLQYDDTTKQLWDELQRPYGNQSSFIRHLVLLEKYFRNGDLVLSKNASSSAATYSESVQTRLRAFDSVEVSAENRTLLKQLSNAPITITQKTREKVGERTQSQVTITPGKIPSPPPLVPTNTTITPAPQAKVVVEAGASLLKKAISTLPPDLISISSATTVATANAVKSGGNAGGDAEKTTVSVPAATTVTPSSGAPPTTGGTASATATATNVSPGKRTGSPSKARETVMVTLPDMLSPQDRKLVNGKSWRPTLMPVEKIELNEDGTRTMFKTADGRLLPARVQVMSGGKPYHISIYDYNRMCILRREKLMQKANGQKAGGADGATISPASTSPPSTTTALAANGKVTGPLNNSTSGAQTRQTIVAPTVQIPNTVLEQNSFVPVTATGFLAMQPINGAQQQPQTQQSNGSATRRNSRSREGKGAVAGNALSMVNLGSQITATVTTTNNNSSSGNSNNNNVVGEKEPQKVANQHWMWNPGDMSMDRGEFPAPAAVVMDSSAASLLSKIPKSLTVIPQQKLM